MIFAQIGIFAIGFCLKFPKFLIWEKSAKLTKEFAWVRPKYRSELGTQNRKKTGYVFTLNTEFIEVVKPEN